MNPKISIILPIYNVEDDLQEALNSVLNQTMDYRDLEVIMVNDHSTDKSGDIIDQYSNDYSNFKAIHLSENSGSPGKPRNIGMELAKGDYIMFLDPDDYYAPDACEVLYDKITHENADIVSSQFIFLYNDKIFPSGTPLGEWEEIELQTIDDDENIFRLAPSIWTKIYDKNLIEKNKIRFIENDWAEDVEFNAHTLFHANKIIHLNNFLSYYYRIRNAENKSFTFTTNKKNLIKLMNGYYAIDSLLERHEKEEFFNVIFSIHLVEWTKKLVLSEMEDDEKIELILHATPLIKKFTESQSDLEDQYIPLFKNISEENFNEAISNIKTLSIHLKNSSESPNDENYLIKDSEHFEDPNRNLKHFKISIIIPTHNMEKYISQTLDSLLNQTIGPENLEVIMVDDCSTDNTPEIIDKYARKYENFIPIHLTENSGLPGKPRNIGLEKATGEYVMFMDHDDCYASDAMERLYKKITNEGADVIFSRYNYFIEVGSIKPNPNLFGDTTEVIVDNIDKDHRLLQTAPTIWTKMFKRSFIINNHIRFPEGMLAEDLSFVTHAFIKANGIIYLNDYYSYYYRIRDSEQDKSTIRIKNKKYLKAMIDGYYHTYSILRKLRKEDYFPLIYEDHLKFWLNSFIHSSADTMDKKELLYEVAALFKKINSYDVNLKEHSVLSTSISHGQFNTALQISDLMFYYQKRESELQNYHQKIEENLQKQLEAKKKQIAELQTVRGYSKYKGNNISGRFKKRFKG